MLYTAQRDKERAQYGRGKRTVLTGATIHVGHLGSLPSSHVLQVLEKTFPAKDIAGVLG
jgi:hypothetical protein